MSRGTDVAGQNPRLGWLRLAELELAGVFGLLVLVGCGSGGPKTAHVKGTVTIGGQAVPADVQGSISFKVTEHDQGKSTSAQIVGGRYDSPKTPTGKLKAFFSIQQPTGKMAREGIGAPYPEYRNLTPAKYETGMDVEITGDNDTQDFDL
jgi:hypothetical protein